MHNTHTHKHTPLCAATTFQSSAYNLWFPFMNPIYRIIHFHKSIIINYYNLFYNVFQKFTNATAIIKPNILIYKIFELTIVMI